MVIVAGVITIVLCCSSSRKFEMKMVSAIVANCQGHGECTLRPKDVTNFQWDRMYAFDYSARESEVEQILGTKYHWGGEFHRKIIFMKGSKIVFHEEEPTDVEYRLKDEVAFDFAPNTDYKLYSHDVIFKVSKHWGRNGIYYKLTEVH